ncbi:MAG: class I SAM-dependent methyltransferase [bacterium]
MEQNLGGLYPQDNMDSKIQTYPRKSSYEDYHIDLNKVYYKKIINAINRFSHDPHGRLLDIGCFDGTLASQFIDQRSVFGVEGYVEPCKRAQGKKVKAILADLDKGLPFHSNFFDCVIAAEIIEHLYDTDFFLQEIKRVLKNKGILVMSLPNIACLSNRIKMLFGGYPRYAEYKAGGAGHIRVYTAKAIKDQLNENGFNILSYHGCNLPLPMHNRFIPYWIKKIAIKGGNYLPGIAGQIIITCTTLS